MNRIVKLILPLFCLSFILTGCNKYDDIKAQMEAGLVGYQYDEVVVEEKNNVILVYVYDHNKTISGGTCYSISIYVYDNGSFTYIGGYTK